MFHQKLKKTIQNRYNESKIFIKFNNSLITQAINTSAKPVESNILITSAATSFKHNWILHAQRPNFAQASNVSPKQIFGTINYKNIGILRNLINLEGKILSKRITRLSSKKQRQTARAIKCGRVLGLLPFVHKSPPFKRKLRVRNFRNRSRNSMRARRNTRRV